MAGLFDYFSDDEDQGLLTPYNLSGRENIGAALVGLSQGLGAMSRGDNPAIAGQAMLQAREMVGERKQRESLYQMANDYADKVEATNPTLASAIRRNPSLVSEIVGAQVKSTYATPTSLARNMALMGVDPKSLTPEQKMQMLSGGNSITLDMGPAGSAFGKGFAENLAETAQGGGEAAGQISTFNSMLGLLDEGMQTGRMEEALLPIRGYLRNLGVDVEGMPQQELFSAWSRKLIIPAVKQLGVNPTDKDLQFVVESEAGLGKTPEGNRVLLQTAILGARRKQELARWSSQWLAQNPQILQDDVAAAQAMSRYYDDLNQFISQNPLWSEKMVDNIRQSYLNAAGSQDLTDQDLQELEDEDVLR